MGLCGRTLFPPSCKLMILSGACCRSQGDPAGGSGSWPLCTSRPRLSGDVAFL